MNIIDLFSGAGGLTEGFRDDFNIISHVEKESAACETLKVRDSFYYLNKHNRLDVYIDYLNGKISIDDLFNAIPDTLLKETINQEINDDSIDNIFNKIDEELGENEVSGIIGGPPCQAYSTIGRARNAGKKATDGRIYLYRYYIDFLKKYKPIFFVFENVKGLLSFKDKNGNLLFPQMQKEFKDAGYSLDYRLVNAADYGVPQTRERIIIFGTKFQNYKLIDKFFDELSKQKTKNVPVKVAFMGLPFLKAGEKNNTYTSKTNVFVDTFYRKYQGIPLTQNESRPNKINDLKIYKIVAEAKLKGINFKYNELDKNLITHKHTDKFLDRYKAIPWDKPSHTVVAHISKDGHHYIHPNPKENRSITIREAARLQGFPDDYYFETSRTTAFIQIGNAVPPILSRKISNAIVSVMER